MAALTVLQPPPVFSALDDKGGVIVPIWQAWFVAVQAGQTALVNAPVLVTTATAALPSSVNLGALTTGLLKATVAAGVATISSVATIPIANGGTNATSQTNSGIAYFDSTKITSTANATLDGSGNATFAGTLGVTGIVSASNNVNLITNNFFLNGTTTGAVSKALIGVNASNLCSIDANGLGITVSGVLTMTPNTLMTMTAPANQNSQFKAVATASNGFGAQFIASSKTTGGATNTWTTGTGVTGGTNAYEFYNDSISALVMKLYLNGTIALPNLQTSTAGLAAGDIWVDTTGALNILKRV